jgi:N4-gp56 family major capsid protein
MVANASVNFQGDISRYLASKTLRLSQRYLVLRQFAEKVKIPEGEGLTYTATRYPRVPLPYGPLNEGVQPVGESMTIQQVTGVAIQWGDLIRLPDVATITIKHPLIDVATELLSYQVAETYERNLWVNLVGSAQVNYVNSRGSRFALQAGDVLDPTTVNRTVVNLKNAGAPSWLGPDETNVRRGIEDGPNKADMKPMAAAHYVAVGSPLMISGDFYNNATVQNAWSRSDVNKLYINEVGYWSGLHFTESNMTPSWTGFLNSSNGVTYTPSNTGGSLVGTGSVNYYLVVTGADTQNQYESQIYAISGAQAITSGTAGSINVLTPSVAGFTYSVYIGTSTTLPMNLGLSSAGPTTGPFAGQAVQLPPATTVTITGLGLNSIPSAAPANGVTVYPMMVFGKDAFACIELERLTWTRLFEADKSDPLNQQRIVGWKGWDGTILSNQTFMARIEGAVSNSGVYT